VHYQHHHVNHHHDSTKTTTIDTQQFPPNMQLAGAEGNLVYQLQAAPLQIATLQMGPNSAMAVAQMGGTSLNLMSSPHLLLPSPTALINQQISEMNQRSMRHDMSPEIATKSLSALKDRKQEIISELKEIVGPTAAKAIGDMASQQAAGKQYGMNCEPAVDMSARKSNMEGGVSLFSY